MKRYALILGWLVIFALTAVLPLSALFHGIVHVGPEPLVSDRRQTAPLIALGGNVSLRHGTRAVVVAILGDVSVRGRAADDVLAIGGRVYLNHGATVDGDVVSLLGGVYRSRDATVGGRIGGALHQWDGTAIHHRRNLPAFLFTNIRLGMAAGLALLLIGTCLTIVFPWQIVLISGTLRRFPLKSGAAGLLCLLTFMFLVVPLGLSLAGLPFALLLTGAASLAWLFGLTAAALVIGRFMSRSPASMLWSTAAGLVLLALGMAVPLAGPLIVAAVGLAGAGALAVALISRSQPALSAL